MASNFAFWYLKNVYTVDELKEMNGFIEQNFDPELEDKPAEFVVKTAKVRSMGWKLAAPFMEKAYQAAKYINSTEIGYDLFDMTHHNTINYNVYDSINKAEYDWHVDATPPGYPTDIKLTVVINASTEKYAGGDFELFRQGVVKAPEFDEPGTVIVFPSYVNHKVHPVVYGKRKSISFWIPGPKFR